jgi:hypothetical protein
MHLPRVRETWLDGKSACLAPRVGLEPARDAAPAFFYSSTRSDILVS